ncbi:hypothetical protein DWZ63_10690 [Clostridium sp. AF34-13]|jgi:hypothetical protein|uniref:hypothetical protein n=1 Tax=Clostridium sp. AF34-13 TaxID=2293012 RepID=UPI000E4868D5|nr:hypothetical protein [Clostridium sp. AF34-13]RHP24412.1 hypothetical protein DWZ63_10690 [Clostridium sp. AF34-13]
MEEKYLEIARKYLCDTKEGLNKSICITIKISDIDNAEDKEKFIKEKIETTSYKFSMATIHTDQYGIKTIMLFNQ